MVLLLSVVTIGPYLFLQGSTGTLASIATFLRSISPIPAVMQIVGHGDVGGQGLAATTNTVTRFCITAWIPPLIVANILPSDDARPLASRGRNDRRSLDRATSRPPSFLSDRSPAP
jgi:hypothetical protein